uniref:SMB domain-containing protein n=1 Tax=Gongylonema pulchrum TaxID=637853 RepID=A0A183EQY7_9BILA
LSDRGEPLQAVQLTNSSSSTTVPTTAYRQLIFGEAFHSSEPEITRYYRHHKLIRYQDNVKLWHFYCRYSVLNQLIPLIIKDSREGKKLRGYGGSKIAFLEKNGAHDSICFCDEKCIAFGDCCTDYTFVCPPSDCFVTEWSMWSSCLPDREACGIGIRTRKRTILRKAERGGKECPPLVEKMSCFKECQEQQQQRGMFSFWYKIKNS